MLSHHDKSSSKERFHIFKNLFLLVRWFSWAGEVDKYKVKRDARRHGGGEGVTWRFLVFQGSVWGWAAGRSSVARSSLTWWRGTLPWTLTLISCRFSTASWSRRLLNSADYLTSYDQCLPSCDFSGKLCFFASGPFSVRDWINCSLKFLPDEKYWLYDKKYLFKKVNWVFDSKILSSRFLLSWAPL